MKLESFRIYDYKSIVDSWECKLSKDNITIFAGQNESWKSSILYALRDFWRKELDINSNRFDGQSEFSPKIICRFSYDKRDFEVFNEKILFNLFELIKDDIKTINLTLSKIDNVNTLKLDDSLEEQISQKIRDSFQTWIEEQWWSEEAADESTKEIMLWLIKHIKKILPVFIHFEDFCDQLPDKFLLSDLTSQREDIKWYKAVKNIEKILQIKFEEWQNLWDQTRRGKETHNSKTISANFWEFWKQRVTDDMEPKIHIEYNQWWWQWAYLNFFIETIDGRQLAPSQRSQWFKWFLSFYLQLKAESESYEDLVILFDEPWLFLHAKAQNDIKRVFDELAKNSNKDRKLWDQIIYTTHSPYLIDVSNYLNRLRLIINDKIDGTTIEKITTNKITDRKDTIMPIIHAMGIDLLASFAPIAKKNILTEGISDYYYLTAMKKILDPKGDYSFIPGSSVHNIHFQIEFCIWRWLKWLVIMDKDTASEQEWQKLNEYYPETVNNKIKKLSCKAIESMFGENDLVKLWDEFINKKKPYVILGKKKEIYARLFYDLVSADIITKNDLNQETNNKFQEIFTRINENLSLT